MAGIDDRQGGRVAKRERLEMGEDMPQPPFSVALTPLEPAPARALRTIRTLSALKDQYLDATAVARRLTQGDPILYEVYHCDQRPFPGDLSCGLTILLAGRVGQEYFMTKGHFHEVLDTAEVYYCLRGRGLMLMETPEGDATAEPILPGMAVYVPPRWAHRTVNTDDAEDLVMFFVYPAQAGHDYRTIEVQGFRKLVVATPEGPTLVDNPRWKSRGG